MGLEAHTEDIGPYTTYLKDSERPRYFGYDRQTSKEVVIKGIHDASKNGQRIFENEREMLSRFDHPHICRLDAAITHNDQPFIVIPRLGSEDFDFYLDTIMGRPEQSRHTEILENVANALHYMHSLGYAHLDVKPANVIVHNGKGVLIDFEAAQKIGQEHMLGGYRQLTPFYAPPEFFKGEFSERSDVFSFALMLFRALTLDEPFDYNLDSYLRYDRPWHDEHRMDATQLSRLVKSGLSLDPTERPPMYAFVEALTELNSKLRPLHNGATSALSPVPYAPSHPLRIELERRTTVSDASHQQPEQAPRS